LPRSRVRFASRDATMNGPAAATTPTWNIVFDRQPLQGEGALVRVAAGTGLDNYYNEHLPIRIRAARFVQVRRQRPSWGKSPHGLKRLAGRNLHQNPLVSDLGPTCCARLSARLWAITRLISDFGGGGVAASYGLLKWQRLGGELATIPRQ